MRIVKCCLMFCFVFAILSMASSDSEATGRGRCRRSEAPMPPGNYAIVVAGPNEQSIVDAIERVVDEERQARPALYQNSTIKIFDSSTHLPEGLKAISVITVGNTSAPASYLKDPDHLLIVVPKIFENTDPQYVRSVKVDTAGIHLALRSILFFSGEAKETDELMGVEHFVALPDEFAESTENEQHKH
jgi:hypothetical protein